LDLSATGDRARVAEAMEALARFLESGAEPTNRRKSG
jgi:hypothetical protein